MRSALSISGLALLTLCLGACCNREPVAGVLVINDTEKPITALVEGSEEGPLEILANQDAVLTAPSEKVTIKIKTADGQEKVREVATDLEALGMIATTDACIAMADYTDQYEGEGRVKVLARTGPNTVGRIKALPFQGIIYRGPLDGLPPDIPEDKQVIRFTPVPCDLLPEEKAIALEAHLYMLK